MHRIELVAEARSLELAGCSCFTPAASQQALTRSAGLLRITLVAYDALVLSATMFSSHSLCASNAMRMKLTVPALGIVQRTRFAVVPLFFSRRSSSAKLRSQVWMSFSKST